MPVNYNINPLGGFNPGEALQNLGDQFREQGKQADLKSQREQMQGLMLKARQGDSDAMDQVFALNPEIGMEIDNHFNKMTQEKGVAQAKIIKNKTLDWATQWKSADMDQREMLKEQAFLDENIDFGEDEQNLTNEQFDDATNFMLHKEFGKGLSGGEKTERQRNLETLQSMPSGTEQEIKEREEAAFIFGAKPKTASVEEKIKLDKSKQQTKEDHAISLAKKKDQNQRLQGFIDSGISSAENLISVNRSLELLNSVETGGIDNALIKGKQILGLESADEAELSYNLGKSVLTQLKPTFGAAFTVDEMLELKRMESGLGKSVAGNKRILNNLKKILNRSARRGMAAAKRQGEDFTYNEIKSLMGGGQPMEAGGQSQVQPVKAIDQITPEQLKNMTPEQLQSLLNQGQ